MPHSLLFWALLVPPALAQSSMATPAVPSLADITRTDIAVMEYVVGAPLTPAEKLEVSAYDAEGLRTSPGAFRRGYQNAQVALTLATYHNAVADAESAENWRRDMENLPGNDQYRLIADRRDPVAAVRRGEKTQVTEIVTERSLRTLARAAAWASSGARLPAPPSNLIEAERGALKRNYAVYPPELQMAYAHIARNFATATAFLAEVKPNQAQDFLHARLTRKQAADPVTGPGAATALLVQDLYNEALRRGYNPVQLSLRHSNDPLMQMYTYNAMRDAWKTMNP